MTDPFDWRGHWETGYLPWQMETFHPMLQKHIGKLTNDKQSQKLFLPMCGKTADMMVLAQMRHSVVGVEYCRTAILQFFEQNKITYTEKCISSTQATDDSVFESNGLNIKIYCIDIIKFDPKWETGFDGVWDRAAFESIGIPLRKRYTNLMKAMLKKGTNYLMEIRDRPPGVGPPYCIPAEEIAELYGLLSLPQRVDYREYLPCEVPRDGNVSNQFIYYFKMT